MEILIQAAEQLPPQIQALAQLAAKEGYEPLTRLIEEYQSGKNRFDQKHRCRSTDIIYNPASLIHDFRHCCKIRIQQYHIGNILGGINAAAATNRQLEGTVSWIASEAEFTPKIIQTKKERVKLVYAAKVKVPNDGSLKIGMPGEIRL